MKQPNPPTPRSPLTVDRSQDDPGVVVRYHVSVAVFGLVDFQVRVLPGELLAGVDGLEREAANPHRCEQTCLAGNGELRALCNADVLPK